MRFAGTKLKQLRDERKWDQHTLAEKARAHGVGITQASVSRYENGKEPSGLNALAMARALNVDVNELYTENAGGEDDEESSQVPHSALYDALKQELLAAIHDPDVRAELRKAAAA